MIDIREKPQKVEWAFLVAVQHPGQEYEEVEDLINELEELVETLGLEIRGRQIVKLRKFHSRLILGTGKADEIIETAKGLDCDCIVFDDYLSPSQQRNWEKLSNLCVIDRREVILDIFAERASTKEAQLQIDLARAEYDMPRLTRAWTHLHRQRGAVMQRGEGELQIELDRRMVRQRIDSLQRELKKVRRQRSEQRKKRQRRPIPNAAIVGYTNAGKSSLLNRLCDADIYADDKLFATLDPTTRRIFLENNQEMLLTDTVGFIRKLPHDLVEAFKATLEEAVLADFHIHVLDASNPEVEAHMRATETVLAELGADQKRMITVFNKMDKITDNHTKVRLRNLCPEALFISVHSGEGIEKFLEDIQTFLEDELKLLNLKIPSERYDIIALLHRTSKLMSEEYENEWIYVRCQAPEYIRGEIQPFIYTGGTDV